MPTAESANLHAQDQEMVFPRRVRASFSVRPGADAFDLYDGFIRSQRFLSPAEVCRLIVAGDEIIDNLLTHGEVGTEGVRLWVTKRASGLTLGFLVESHERFARFAASEDSQAGMEPRYDERERRWHGLGLVMCRNLASGITYRPGLRFDAVFLSFRIARSAP
jgi:hypothetical protein